MRHRHSILYWLLGLCMFVTGIVGALRMGQVEDTQGHLPWPGYVLGFVLGCLAVPVFAVAAVGMLYATGLARQAGTRYPPCPSAQCRGGRSWSLGNTGDYEWHAVEGVKVLRCKCGHDLVVENWGSRTLLRLPDGTLQPYMVHREYCGWWPDPTALRGTGGP